MSDKKYSRSMPAITRESYNVEKAPRLPNWMDEFAANLEKSSTQSKSKANSSIYDQISSIMGNKSKYPTVEAAVDDMKERSGMKKFIDKLQSQGQNEGSTKKKAECGPCAEKHDNKKVQVFEDVPQLKETIDNYTEETHGNLPLPAIIEKIKSIHKSDVVDDSAWDDDGFLHYVNDKNIESKKKHPNEDINYRNLGKLQHFNDDEIDPSNNDALHALTPAVVSK